jgi:chemotaxis protein CheC
MDPIRHDILQETGNIGAAHAATALGQLLERTVMISVTDVREAAAADIGGLAGDPEALVAGVAFHVVGDASARILFWLPRRSALELVDTLLRNPVGTTKALNDLGNSTVKETGNILASAYLNGLSEFCGLLLLPSVPALNFDLSHAVLELGTEGVELTPESTLLCVTNDVSVEGTGITGKLFLFVDASSEPVLVDNASGVL